MWSSGLAVAHTRADIYSDVCMYRRQLIVCSESVPVIAVSLLTGCIELLFFSLFGQIEGLYVINQVYYQP